MMSVSNPGPSRPATARVPNLGLTNVVRSLVLAGFGVAAAPLQAGTTALMAHDPPAWRPIRLACGKSQRFTHTFGAYQSLRSLKIGIVRDPESEPKDRDADLILTLWDGRPREDQGFEVPRSACLAGEQSVRAWYRAETSPATSGLLMLLSEQTAAKAGPAGVWACLLAAEQRRLKLVLESDGSLSSRLVDADGVEVSCRGAWTRLSGSVAVRMSCSSPLSTESEERPLTLDYSGSLDQLALPGGELCRRDDQ